MLLLSFIACGDKKSDTASTTDTANTQNEPSSSPTSEPSNGQPTSEPSSGQPSSEPSSSPTSEPSTDDTGTVVDGNNETNNSETPPTGACTENSVVANIEAAYDTEQFFPTFLWDWQVDQDGLLAYFVGYKVPAEIDICSIVQNALDIPPYPQVLLMVRPMLSELPSEYSIGIWGESETASAMAILGDPTIDRNFWTTEGFVGISSIIEGEKSRITGLSLAALVEDTDSGFSPVAGYVTADTATEVVSCWCDGLASFYSLMASQNQ
jgi:hypothetical protein